MSDVARRLRRSARNWRVASRAALLTLGVVLLAACSSAKVPTVDDPFTDQVAAAIEDAQAGGPSDAQLAILVQAQADGAIGLEAARTAGRAVVDCINVAGGGASYQEYTTGAGLIIPAGTAITNTAEELALVDACTQQESYWVDYLYQTQPSSKKQQDAFLDAQAPLVRECMESKGESVPADATTRDVLGIALDVALKSDWGTDCLNPYDIKGF